MVELRAFRVAYDGTDYHGYQRQPTVSTVEDAIFDALSALDVFDASGEKPEGYAAAGRTDAGVSATCQTIALAAPDWLTPRALNAELPADVRAWASAPVRPDFHATHDAARRRYEYHLYAPPEGGAAERCRFGGSAVRQAPEETSFDPLDETRFRRALDALSGRHDFHNLTPDDRGTERTVSLSASRDGHFLTVSVESSGFARELVRRLVSLASDVGRGKRSIEAVDRALSPESLPGPRGVQPAPPEPLVLAHVSYPDVSFEVDGEATTRATRIFEERRLGRLVGARTSSALVDGIGD